MQNESNADSSIKSFLYYFNFAFSDHLLLKVTIVSFLTAAKDRFNCSAVRDQRLPSFGSL